MEELNHQKSNREVETNLKINKSTNKTNNNNQIEHYKTTRNEFKRNSTYNETLNRTDKQLPTTSNTTTSRSSNDRVRNLKPERARYQPPGSRLLEKNETTSEHNKQSSETKIKPDNQRSINFNKEERSKTTSQLPSNDIKKKAPMVQLQSESIPSHTGGILKINMNEIKLLKAKDDANLVNYSDHHTYNDNDSDTNDNNTRNRRPYKIANDYLNATPSMISKNQQLKCLFNPNNPDKPIFIQNKSTNSNSVRINQDYQQQQLYQQQQQFDNFYEDKKQLKKTPQIIAFDKLLTRIEQTEVEIKTIIDKFDITSDDSVKLFISNINPLRDQFGELCIETSFLNIELSTAHNVDTNHWRLCYHQIIEMLRKENNLLKQYNSNSKTKQNQSILKSLNDTLESLLNEGVQFYLSFIQRLESQILKFSTQDYIESLNYSNRRQRNDIVIRTKTMKFALMCLHRCWICMGDLSRYQQLIFVNPINSIGDYDGIKPYFNATTQRDYSSARQYYLNAMYLAPKNSRSYHQLAILALYTKRRLDGIFI
jgi:hypothetical protein